MKKIASFTVDHDKLEKGMYISRIDGDAVTYDIRMKKPNGGDYLSNGALHTFEHLFATFVRNGKYSDSVIYGLLPISRVKYPEANGRNAEIILNTTLTGRKPPHGICFPF